LWRGCGCPCFVFFVVVCVWCGSGRWERREGEREGRKKGRKEEEWDGGREEGGREGDRMMTTENKTREKMENTSTRDRDEERAYESIHNRR